MILKFWQWVNSILETVWHWIYRTRIMPHLPEDPKIADPVPMDNRYFYLDSRTGQMTELPNPVNINQQYDA